MTSLRNRPVSWTRHRATCTIAAMLAWAGLATAAPGRPFDVDALWAMHRLSQATPSPDGRWVAFVVTSYDMEENASGSDVWVVAVDGNTAARRLTTAAATELAPFWSPDSRRVAYVVRDGETPHELGVVDVAGGEPKSLLRLPVSIRCARWPRNGRIVFEAETWPDLNGDFAAIDARAQQLRNDKTQPKISESRLLRYGDAYRTDGRVPHLFELDLANAGIRDLMPGFDRLTGLDGFEWDVAADGTEIVYSANSTPAPHRELNFDLYALDVATGHTTNLTPGNPGPDTKPVIAPDRRRVAYNRGERAQGLSELATLAVLERSRDRVTRIGTALDAGTSSFRWSSDGAVIYFNAERAGRLDLYGARLDGKARLLAEGGSIESIAPVHDGVAYLRHDFAHPAELFIVRTRFDFARPLTAFNAKRLAGIAFGRVGTLRYAGHGGERVSAWVVHPPGYRAGTRWPVLLLAHGGPFGAWNDAFSYRWNPQLLAARGYLVVLPNFHGSTGYGQAWADAIVGNHGEKPAADMLAALDVLAQRRDVDPQRIAIAGHSYGGYLATLLTGLTDRFAAAVVHAGVFDLTMQFASDQSWGRAQSYGHAPWTNPVELDRWSPSRLAPKFATPTLVLHGEKDFRVPVTQGITLHGVLTGKGVPSRIVIFPDENHWIIKPQASRIWHRELFAWLERWMPEEP